MKNSHDNTSRADMEKALKEATDRVKEKRSQFSNNNRQAQIKRNIERKQSKAQLNPELVAEAS